MSGAGGEEARINLKVQGQDGEEIFFLVNRSQRLRKLMARYAARKSLDVDSLTFLFDGGKITSEQTPKELGMEECDIICAMLPQTGGGEGACRRIHPA